MPSSAQKQLFDSARSGDLKEVQTAIEKGARVNVPDDNNNGATALLLAAWGGYTLIVKWLLDNGASIKERDKFQNTALLMAAGRGHIETVQELLEHGATLKERDHLGDTALILATFYNQTNMVAWLLEHGADPGEYNTNNKTALQVAKDLDIKTLLREWKAKRAAKATASATSTTHDTTVTGREIESEELQMTKCLGVGAYGKVFQGTYKLAQVAIKQLLVKNLTQQQLEEFEEEFKQEAQLMASLRHPNIVQFYGWVNTVPYKIVMEWMEKGSLYHVLHHSGFEVPSWSQRINWAIEIGTGLHFLHTLKPPIWHRDLKSLNVLISKNNIAKLSDFGLAMANLRSQAQDQLLQKKAVEERVGSLRWMAPELFSSPVPYSDKSDVFAYAIVLWELASRMLPYATIAERDIEIFVQDGKREVIPSDCPKAFAALIIACWAQQADQRPSAEVVVKQLQQLNPSDDQAYFVTKAITRSRGYTARGCKSSGGSRDCTPTTSGAHPHLSPP